MCSAGKVKIILGLCTIRSVCGHSVYSQWTNVLSDGYEKLITSDQTINMQVDLSICWPYKGLVYPDFKIYRPFALSQRPLNIFQKFFLFFLKVSLTSSVHFCHLCGSFCIPAANHEVDLLLGY